MKRATSLVALVDWDNVIRTRVETELDAELAVEAAVALVVDRALTVCPDVTDAHLRLYGSWQWRNGTETRFGILISNAASAANRRDGNVYLTVSNVSSLAAEAEFDVGPRLTPFLSRTSCRCSSGAQVNEQKLADTMIVSDAIYFAQFPDYAVAVVSDDIDMSPGLMVASSIRYRTDGQPSADLIWLRPTANGGTATRRFSRHFKVI